jgi:hypothetical protein
MREKATFLPRVRPAIRHRRFATMVPAHTTRPAVECRSLVHLDHGSADDPGPRHEVEGLRSRLRPGGTCSERDLQTVNATVASQRSLRWSPVIRLASFGVTCVLLTLAGVVALLTFQAAATAGRLGADLDLYVSATRGFLADQGFYPAHQLGGAYVIADGDILYPPTTILLFLPFVVLPALAFWTVPLAMTAAVVAFHRPRAWTWPLLAAGIAYPVTILKLVHGNPVMWVVAAVALGTVFAWPAAFAVLKPSLAPFSLIGARRRSWWIALGVLGVASLPFLDLWRQYVQVLLDARNPNGVLYSLDEVPFVLVPIVAWVGSTRARPRWVARLGWHAGQPDATD